MRFLGWNQFQISIVLLTTLVSGQTCTNPVTRKEIRELTQTEFNDYISAVKSLQNYYSSGSKYSAFENYSRLHDLSHEYIHNDPSFFPWHREFLYRYEQSLRYFKPNLVLPYWDWTLDYEYPHTSLILSKLMMGSNGDPDNDYCLKNGPFANTNLLYASDQGAHCLRRNYDNQKNITSFVPPEVILSMFKEKRFSYFSLPMEVYHGYPHNGIGGDTGDFSTMYSPSDPLFYLHHAFIDLIFTKWQETNGLNIRYEGDRYRKLFRTSSEKLRNFDVTVAQAWNTKGGRYCYQYPAYPRLIPTPSYLQNNTLATNELPIERRDYFNEKENGENPKKREKEKRRKSFLEKLSGARKDRISKLLEKNPLFNDDEEEEDEDPKVGRNLKQITERLLKKHGGKGSRRARKNARKPKKLPDRWIERNGFSKEDVEEVQNDTLNLLDALNSIEGFVSLADAKSLDSSPDSSTSIDLGI